jgi:hypothetical protein
MTLHTFEYETLLFALDECIERDRAFGDAPERLEQWLALRTALAAKAEEE